jgi:UDP-N-acetylmuramate--alanine ligase
MTYHFIGLGGIGMSALARILLQKGCAVQGTDAASSLLLEELGKEGASVQVGHSIDALKDAQTVVYSSGIKEDNVELVDAKQRNLRVLHRSDLLSELMKDKKNILVSGSHGKTTTTALLSFVLMQAGLDPSFAVGGLIRSLNTNGRWGSGEYFIAEADESDGSFLKSSSFISIATNLSDDHLDYWGNARKLELAFTQFMAQAGSVVWCADDARLSQMAPKGFSYGFSPNADYRILNYRETEAGIVFDLKDNREIAVSLHGKHNALNAAAVFIVATQLQIPLEIIRSAFSSFSGTARRLEFKGSSHRVCLYDDYAHHPREIAATLSAIRGKIRERRLVVVFQPHRYTRVRDLLDLFVDCFHEADAVFLTDIYSAGEAAIEGISSAALFHRMREKLGVKLQFLPRNYLETGVAAFLKPFDVVLTIGAGDITKVGEPILQAYAAKAPKIKAAILFGGASAEHEVSLMSMRRILTGFDPSIYDTKLFGITKEGIWTSGLDLEKKEVNPKISSAILEELSSCDVCFPIFHGPRGEDGMVAAILDALHLPYIGCDYRSGAICMHKTWSKNIAMAKGIATASYIEIQSFDYAKDPVDCIEKIEEALFYPVWVKPVHLGSSIGVNRAVNQEELKIAMERVFQFDDVAIVEKEMVGREIEFAILGNDYLLTALPGEIVNEGKFFSYDGKYGQNAMEIKIPAILNEEERNRGIEIAKTIYKSCGCKGLARVDFFIDSQGTFWFNEINPCPGFTATSGYPKMWEATGKELPQLIDELVFLAFHKSRKSLELEKREVACGR